MATAEGTLVTSTSRGCKALNLGGGVCTVITQDGMTHGPAVEFPSVLDAGSEGEEGLAVLKRAFESTSRFARLVSVKGAMAGRVLYVRFKSTTGG
jgi:hydroxymethylglutaryl-CoA reductase (NADPH)